MNCMRFSVLSLFAQVDRIVPLGAIEPDNVHTPGIFVHRVIEADSVTKGGF